MTVNTFFKRVTAVFLFLLAATRVHALEARLPYRYLYEIQKAQALLDKAHTNLILAVTMNSTLPDVKTADLNVWIDSKSGKIPVALHQGGEFTVPMSDDLLAENPWIETNQRQGTMKLDWKVGVVLGRLTNSIHYTRLMAPLRATEDIQKQMLGLFPGSPPLAMTGLKLDFPSAQHGPVVVIHAKAGDRKLDAPAHGEIVVPLTPDLWDEDPEVTFSDTPDIVEITSRQK